MERITMLGTATPPERTPRGLRRNGRDAFGRLSVDWHTPWGEINRFQRLSGDIELDFDDERAEPCRSAWPPAAGARSRLSARNAQEGTKRLYGDSGNSFVAVVEFGDRVRAKSILAGGQSSDPDSPHFDDQAPRYVDHEFKDVAYYRDDVERRAQERYRPGERSR